MSNLTPSGRVLGWGGGLPLLGCDCRIPCPEEMQRRGDDRECPGAESCASPESVFSLVKRGQQYPLCFLVGNTVVGGAAPIGSD